jgi:hypothetical protein
MQGGPQNCRLSARPITSTRVRFAKSAKHSASIGPNFPDRRAASEATSVGGLFIILKTQAQRPLLTQSGRAGSGLIISTQKVGHRTDELFVGIWFRQKRTAFYKKLFHAVGKGSTTGVPAVLSENSIPASFAS